MLARTRIVVFVSLTVAVALLGVTTVAAVGGEPSDIESDSVRQSAGPVNVTLADHTTTGENVTVSSVTLPDGGVVVVQSGSAGSPDGVIGRSNPLPPGEHRNVTISLDSQLTVQSSNDTQRTVWAIAESGGKDAIDSATVTITPPDIVFPGQSNPATDLDADLRLEDVDGDGVGTVSDVLVYYENRRSERVRSNPALFDFDGDGASGTVFDALALFEEVA